jgi:hypothetical protein
MCATSPACIPSQYSPSRVGQPPPTYPRLSLQLPMPIPASNLLKNSCMLTTFGISPKQSLISGSSKHKNLMLYSPQMLLWQFKPSGETLPILISTLSCQRSKTLASSSRTVSCSAIRRFPLSLLLLSTMTVSVCAATRLTIMVCQTLSTLSLNHLKRTMFSD